MALYTSVCYVDATGRGVVMWRGRVAHHKNAHTGEGGVRRGAQCIPSDGLKIWQKQLKARQMRVYMARFKPKTGTM